MGCSITLEFRGDNAAPTAGGNAFEVKMRDDSGLKCVSFVIFMITVLQLQSQLQL